MLMARRHLTGLLQAGTSPLQECPSLLTVHTAQKHAGHLGAAPAARQTLACWPTATDGSWMVAGHECPGPD